MTQFRPPRMRQPVRPAVGSVGRPGIVRREVHERFWAAIRQGLPTEKAAVVAGVSVVVGVRWFRQRGGMPTLQAAPMSDRYLSLAEREQIALLRVQGHGVREIARQLGRAASTVSRELRRNAATRSGRHDYQAVAAQWHAQRRARRPRPSKLAAHDALRDYVQRHLAGPIEGSDGKRLGPAGTWGGRRHGRRQDRHWALAWSPQQIAKRLPIDFPNGASMRISHEAIYQALYIEGRAALPRALCMCLRSGRPLRVPRARVRSRGKSFVTPDVMIDRRAAGAADRTVAGHWEGDLIIGLKSSAIGTLVERTTRYTVLLHLPRMADFGTARRKHGPALAGRGGDAVRKTIASTIAPLPPRLRRSLTWDQGAEMAQHARLTADTGLRVHFCQPRSPWQRGSNENVNGLLRQYFPKGTDLSRYGTEHLRAVAAALNDRPKKVLGWKTPTEALAAHLSSTTNQAVATTG